MRPWDIIALSAQALRAHVLRTSLTVLGVIIGVTSVIAIMSIVEGMSHKIEELISSMGSETFYVSKIGIPMSDEDFFNALKRKDLTMSDFRAIQDGCESCKLVSARAETSRSMKFGSEKLNDVDLVGTTSRYFDATDFEIDEGRIHSEFEEDHSRQVVMIGASVKERLLGGAYPIGKRVKIGGYKYDVIGVAKPRGAILGADLDKFAVIPLNTFRKHFGTNRSLDLLVSARSTETMQETIDEVRMILRARRHVQYDEEDDFSILTADAVMELYSTGTRSIRVIAVAIPAIALVVAGIVVMNIMMVSVTERTREIGIRKSVGARRKYILLQFVLEALLMSLLGGVVGIGLGLTAAKLLADAGSLPFIISPVAVASGIIVSTGIGVIFGLYPAAKGSKLDPVEAMRYES